MKAVCQDSGRCDRALPDHTAPRFDEDIRAWVLSRYADVLTAFHSPSLFPSGLNSEPPQDPGAADAMAAMRKETRHALAPAQLRLWRKGMEAEARNLLDQLDHDQPVELVGSYGQPLCLRLAARVTQIDEHAAERLLHVAEPIAAAAAEPFDPSLKLCAKSAGSKLRPYFKAGPEPLRESGFVALALTLPRLLANAWFSLLKAPDQWAALHRHPKKMDTAVEELLRCSGLPNILFRRATEDVRLNGVHIRKGDRVVLDVYAANLDPDRFSHPRQMDVDRCESRHLALGAGPHSCVGAGLIRMAAMATTRPLVERFSVAHLVPPVEWDGGSGYSFPLSLRVCLRKHSRR